MKYLEVIIDENRNFSSNRTHGKILNKIIIIKISQNTTVIFTEILSSVSILRRQREHDFLHTALLRSIIENMRVLFITSN